ncbi:MAG: hypothetical protein ACAI35_16540 [Candidatus Methylacidiphilales bacterium]|nr:hypothetical protein [Candidatus Methylacidiphilales bacterium]
MPPEAEQSDPTPPPPSALQSWRGVQEDRAQMLHQHIAGYQRLISADRPDILAAACAPYYKMLEQIYREDMPLADTLDNSDLVARMEGPSVSSRALSLSVIIALLNDMQTQLGSMVRSIAAGIDPSVIWPRDLEFGLSSFARGSLYLGFELPQPPDGTVFLNGDPLIRAARESLQLLGTASRLVDSNAAFAEVQNALPDPLIRDAALASIERLSPTGRRGILSLSLTGRCFGDQSWRRLTPETRMKARTWMESAPASRQQIILHGVVRQVDLDQRRFDLRMDVGSAGTGAQQPGRSKKGRTHGGPSNFSGVPAEGQGAVIRCRYGSLLEREAKTWLDRTVVVEGDAEIYEGRPRLIYASSVKLIAV